MRASHLGCMQNSPISIIMTIIIAGFVRLACAQGPYNGTIVQLFLFDRPQINEEPHIPIHWVGTGQMTYSASDSLPAAPIR